MNIFQFFNFHFLQVYVIIKKIKRKAASPLTPLDDVTTADGRRRAPLAKVETYGAVSVHNAPIPVTLLHKTFIYKAN